jgi:16S rRNA (cytosine1402-N4)-methyltransferase
VAESPWDSAYHAPVLAAEVLAVLGGRGTVMDGTLGGGGHSEALLRDGDVRRVIGTDRDPQAIASARARLAAFEAEGRFMAVQVNYADIDDAPELAGVRFDGILLDLGVSSHQLDASERGFTFREGAPLDMRMDLTTGETAAEWLAAVDERELIRVLRDYADEPKAGRLAREIGRRRQSGSFTTSDDLVGAIRGALGPRSGAPDFARIFQAVRIAVNDELTGLERALPTLRDRLVPGGVMAVIAYHSGEDRLVKHAFREWSADCTCPPRHPMCTCSGVALGQLLTRRATTAGEAEMGRNPRARSARLRAWRRAG